MRRRARLPPPLRNLAQQGSFKMEMAGQPVNIGGRSEALQYNVFFELENLPARKGRPLAEFEGRAVVEGSPEEREFTEERERQWQEEYATYKNEKVLNNTFAKN